ncbi:tyrosine-type recombinase/integrase [Natronosalvus halobius]|uniref:tyrosine-type recombinase/integrase n=1 Tax=Natronosalvus halobius TaxID=2953746 RepID=UPI00209D331D|nr:site-specific integrase [Natronosalvus halobius]USZ71252.1 site-specific integrase [Natronosalvus halobius]
MSLEPISPEQALELYLADRETELAVATIYSHKSRLGHFVRWCDENNITNLNILTGRKLQEFRLWRRRDGNLSKATEKTQMDTIRVFIKWLESIEGVEPDLHVKVRSPLLSREDNTRDVMLSHEDAQMVLSYLDKYAYASIKHVTVALLWQTMMRRGALRALDISDYHPTEQYLEVKHRPESETPLKNDENGERLIALSDDVCTLLDDWIEMNRPEVHDDYGRKPLLATSQGRIHYSTIQHYCYLMTRPCEYTSACPHGRTVDSCEAVEPDSASKCPSSRSPHALRRGSITANLQQDVPEKAISDRAQVSQDVLEQHYDNRSEKEKMEQRREYFSG